MFELNKETRCILGRPNFACGHIARRLKELGLYDCETKAEDEQAIVIYFLLTQYEKHGDKWLGEANKILK